MVQKSELLLDGFIKTNDTQKHSSTIVMEENHFKDIQTPLTVFKEEFKPIEIKEEFADEEFDDSMVATEFVDVEQGQLELNEMKTEDTNENGLEIAGDWDNKVFQNSTHHIKTMNSIKKRNLQLHVQRTSILKCGYCEKVFNSHKTFWRHVTEIHLNTSDHFSCDSCKIVFRRKEHFVRHLNSKRCSTVSKFKCVKCNKMFQTEDKLNNHVAKNCTNKYFCNICHHFFSKKKEFLSHHDNYTDEIHTNKLLLNLEQCIKTPMQDGNCNEKNDIIPKVYQDEIDSENGITDVQNPIQKASKFKEKVLCGYCEKSFSYKVTMWRHMTEFHLNQSQQFSCDLCEMVFRRKDHLKRHLSSKNCLRNLSFDCENCKKMFIDEDKLKTHVKKNCTNKHFCNICLKYFMKKRDLLSHHH